MIHKTFTKHYFIGDKRIASRIGTGKFNNVYGRNGSYVTAGQQDYAERMNQIESQKEDYYKELGIALGVPTMKGAYGDPENTGVGYNTILTELGDHSVPEAWAQYAKKNDKEDTAPGAPIAWDDPVSPEEPEAGYGYIADNSSNEEETFFYHSDHLGSTSYITDDKGNITQYDAYLPYGELLVDEHTSSEEMPYKFNGKELDEETGLYYYGARYMQPVASIWYGVDPLMEKYTNLSAYVYCHGNPVKLVDPNGMDDYYDKNGNYIGTNSKKTDYIYIAQIKNSFTKDAIKYNIVTGIQAIDEVDLTEESWSNILTDILSKMPDVDTRKLHNGKVSVTIWNEVSSNGIKMSTEYFNDSSMDGQSIAITDGNHTDAHITAFVWPQGSEERKIMNTRSNIQNLLGVHEYSQHFINGYKHKDHIHDKTYENVKKHPTWKKTTPAYKNYINHVIKQHGYE